MGHMQLGNGYIKQCKQKGNNLGHMGNGKHGQMGITVNTADRDGAPWGMGHIDDGAHCQ